MVMSVSEMANFIIAKAHATLEGRIQFKVYQNKLNIGPWHSGRVVGREKATIEEALIILQRDGFIKTASTTDAFAISFDKEYELTLSGWTKGDELKEKRGHS